MGLKNLKKMLRKSSASYAWAEIFKNADFPYLKFFCFSIIKKMTFIGNV